MKKITVGLFNDSFPPMVDGVGMVVDNYARRLNKKCNVVVFVPRYKKIYDDSQLPYKVVRCCSIKIPFLDYSLPLPLFDRKFRHEVKNSNLDIVHIHSPFSIGKYGIKIGKKRKIPVVGTMHSQFRQDFFRAVHFKFLARFLTKFIVRTFDRCDQCFAVNSGMADLYYHDYGVKRLPEVLPNATEMEFVKDKKKSYERINSLHNIEKDDKVFLFVGRINKLKNIFFIVDCLSLLNKRKLNYSYKMLFVGDGQDFHELKRYIHKKKLDNDVILCGNVNDRELLRDYYVRSDLFLFPSLYDASSIVQIEAASQKVPTIFLRGSKTSSDITDGIDGFIVSNEEEFADKIDMVMNDEKLYSNVSLGAYNNVYKNWDTVIDEVYEMYNDMISEGD